MGSDGAFCKHLVATGLAWLSGTVRTSATTDSLLPAEVIREVLDAASESVLAQVTKDRIAWDESLLAETVLAARASRHETPVATNRNAAPRKRHASRRKPSSSAD